MRGQRGCLRPVVSLRGCLPSRGSRAPPSSPLGLSPLPGSGPAPLSLPAEGYFPKPGKKGAEKSCSDSGSDCSSSSGSVRASRGSWGSWSSASSSDGDRKPATGPPRCLLPGKSAAEPGPHPPRAGPAQAQEAVRPVFALLCFRSNAYYLFRLLWVCCLPCCTSFSSVAAGGEHSLIAEHTLLIPESSLVTERRGFSRFGCWAPDHRLSSSGAWA